MDRNKLEKEAEEYAIKDCPDNFLCTRDIAKRGYLAGALPCGCLTSRKAITRKR